MNTQILTFYQALVHWLFKCHAFKNTIILFVCLFCFDSNKEGKTQMRGIWVAQSVKHLTLGFCSGHELMVCEFEPRIRLCAESVEPAWDSLSPSLSAPTLLALLSKQINLKKNFFKEKMKREHL